MKGPKATTASPMNKGQILGVILASAMGIFMVNLDVTIVNIVLPELTERLHLTTTDASLVVLSYLLSLTGTVLIFGRLSDMKGPERIFISGYLLFALGSGLCALAWDLWALAAFRLLQGLGGAMIFATSAVIVMRYIPAAMRGRAYAVNGTLAGLGFALGSPLGGLLSQLFDWRAVFLVNIPIGVLGILLCLRFLTRRDAAAPDKPFDLWGALSSVLTLVLLVWVLHGVADGDGIGLTEGLTLLAAALAGTLFVLIERRREAPLVPLSIFRNRPLNFALAGTGFYYALLQGTAFVFPFYLIHAQGFSSVQAGNLLFAGPIVSMVLGPAAGWLSDKYGPKRPCLAGAGLFVLTVLLFLTYDASTPWWALLAALSVMGVGMSLYSAPILTLTMSHAEAQTAGVLSSIKAVVPYMIGMLGVGLFAALYGRSLSAPGVPEATESLNGFHHSMLLALGIAVAALLSTLLTRARGP